MKSLSTMSSVIILSLLSFAQAAPQSNDADAQALIAKSKSVLEAIQAKDVQALNGLVSENFRSVEMDGNLGTRQELLGAAHEGLIKSFLLYDPQSFRVDNDSILVSYSSAVTLSDAMLKELAQDNLTWPRYSKVSDLWVREGGDWKLKFEQITPVRVMY